MPYVGVGVQQDASKNLLGKAMLKVYGILSFAVILTVGIALLGKHHAENPVLNNKLDTVADVHKTISDSLIGNIDPEAIKRNLRILTSDPHLAGSDSNKKVAYAIADMWTMAGLEDVHTIPYEVLLSYPDFDKPNRVTIRDSAGRDIFKSKGISPVIIPDEQSGKYAGHQWLAWAAPGTVTADVVYCNRGLEADFENLKKMGVDLRGKISLMRYGEGFRGDKVHRAQLHGAIGVILFSDPDDVARAGTSQANVYPNTFWMPNEGVQRGSIMHGDGDPLTPLYPSRKDLYKSRTIQEAKNKGVLPSIPALPISYNTAREILSRMQGRPVPLHWQGAVNVTYRVGPGFKDGDQLTMEVYSSLQTKKIRNVIGYIRGADEPDRYVMLGNHFDAWVYGSIDPNSGTAILAEVARAMMQTINETAWRPARTIVFTAWDAEEYGLIGSTEFVEEYVDILRQRAVVYLNMDCLQGNSSLQVSTIPSLYQAVIKTSKKIENPSKKEKAKGRHTLYDTWYNVFPSKFVGRPEMAVPSGGSDQAAFLNYAGVPVIDFNFKNITTHDTYPLYHTMYETPFVNEHIMDTDDFSVHRAVGQFWAELARYFTDEAVLPFNSTDLAVSILKEYLPDLRTELGPLKYYQKAIDPAKTQLALLTKTAQDFYQMSIQFEKTIVFTMSAFGQNPYDQRHLAAVNERIMNLERCFINPRGIPGAPHARHVLFAVSDKDSYASRVMAGVYDAVDAFKEAKTERDRLEMGRLLAEQISSVQYSVICAIHTLRDVI